MIMDLATRRKYNLANLLLAVLVKHCELSSRKNETQMDKALADLFKKMPEFTCKDQTGNMKNYLKQAHACTVENELIAWISHKLGGNYSVTDLDKSMDIDPALRSDIAACRKTLKIHALEEGESVNRGFYDIHINRLWEKSVTSVDLNNTDNDKLQNYMLYQTAGAARLWEEVTASEHYELPKHCREGLRRILKEPEFKTFAAKTSAFFELGTGSPAKTALILESLKAEGRKAHHFIWVDASTPMLEYNVSKIDTSRYAPMRFSAVSTNFEAVDDMLEFLSERWATCDFIEMPKCYFVLGFTL